LDVDLVGVGDTTLLPLRDARQGQTGAQTVGGVTQSAEADVAAEPQLVAALQRLGLLVDRASVNAARLLIAAGQPVTRENIGQLLHGRAGGMFGGFEELVGEDVLTTFLEMCGLPSDAAHVEAVRQLLARGLPITRPSLERLAGGQSATPDGGDRAASDAVLGQILQAYDLPDDLPYLFAARQLLARGLPLTGENIDRLARTLVRMGATEEEDFQAAAFLQANDLPVTESTISLARGALDRPLKMGWQIQQLQNAVLEAAAALHSAPMEEPSLEGQLVPLLDRAAAQLSQRLLSADGGDRSAVVDTLRRLFSDQGISLENRLARVLSGGDPSQLEGDLRTLLGRLADMAMTVGAALKASPDLQRALIQLREAAPDLANTLQSQQLSNAARPAHSSDQWVSFQIPVRSSDWGYPRTVELRISRRPGRKIDPQHVTLLLRLDLPRLQTVEIGLQILGRQISCSLSSDSAELLPVLRERFDALQEGLESLGYTVGRPSFALLSNEPEAADVAPVVPSLLGRLDVRA